MIAMLSGLWAKVVGYLVVIGGVLVAAAAAYAYAHTQGVNAQKAREAVDANKNRQAADRIDHAVSGKSDSVVADELHNKFSRD